MVWSKQSHTRCKRNPKYEWCWRVPYRDSEGLFLCSVIVDEEFLPKTALMILETVTTLIFLLDGLDDPLVSFASFSSPWKALVTLSLPSAADTSEKLQWNCWANCFPSSVVTTRACSRSLLLARSRTGLEAWWTWRRQSAATRKLGRSEMLKTTTKASAHWIFSIGSASVWSLEVSKISNSTGILSKFVCEQYRRSFCELYSPMNLWVRNRTVTADFPTSWAPKTMTRRDVLIFCIIFTDSTQLSEWKQLHTVITNFK